MQRQGRLLNGALRIKQQQIESINKINFKPGQGWQQPRPQTPITMENLISALTTAQKDVVRGKAVGTLSDKEQAHLKRGADIESKVIAYASHKAELDQAFDTWKAAEAGYNPDGNYTDWERSQLEKAVSQAKIAYTTLLKRYGGLSPTDEVFATVDQMAEAYKIGLYEQIIDHIDNGANTV
jgi:hypothetical protein